ncbi:MAG: DNA topoisomerase 3 [Succinivibrio sp.]
MNRLFIAEKPSVGKAIAEALGKTKSDKGYCETKSGDVVTWCFGHLMELATPDVYLPDDVPMTKSGSKVWREQDLPIVPDRWKIQVKTDCKAQFNVIKKLVQKSNITTIVNCGDPDREGQLLVDEILSFIGNKKPVLRYWSSAVDSVSVKRALDSLESNEKYAGMRNAALGRSHADWLIGMNATRAFTLASRRSGKGSLLSVGRVQTPTLNLVAIRDHEISNFKPQTYYVFKGNFKAANKTFTATLQYGESQKGLDSEGRLIDLNAARFLQQKLANAKTAKVIEFETKKKDKNAPLVYSLASIQAEANAKYGYSAEQILNICQALYEKYKLTTYPRSDCEYLPTVQHQDAAKVLRALYSFHTELKSTISKANPSLKSKVWNDSKITAHHGIIPTQQVGNLSELKDDERNVYMLIVKRYLSQFFPSAKLLATTIKMDVSGEEFACKGSVVVESGYLVVYGGEDDATEQDKNDEKEDSQSLPKLTVGEIVDVLKITPVTAQTKPPASFTEGTLIKAMQNIYNFVPDGPFKKVLKDGDGIGTSATRAGIIAELKRKGFLELVGKKIKATPVGIKLLEELPDLCKNPVLTAMFESQLKLVESGQITCKQFEEKQKSFALQLVEKASKLTISLPGGSGSTSKGAKIQSNRARSLKSKVNPFKRK